MEHQLTISVVKYPYGYVGYVRCWHNNEPIWSRSCQILRPYKQDALQDAKIEKDYLLANGKNLF